MIQGCQHPRLALKAGTIVGVALESFEQALERDRAITGYGQDADRARSRARGFDLHLVKPVDPMVLLGVLREAPCAAAQG